MLNVGYVKFRDESVSKESNPAANELDPRFYFVFVKSMPKMMSSNINYIDWFGLKKSGPHEFCLMLVKKTIEFVKNGITPSSLGVNPNDFDNKVNDYLSTKQSIVLISGFMKGK